MRFIALFGVSMVLSSTITLPSQGKSNDVPETSKLPIWQGILLGQKNPSQIQGNVSQSTAQNVIQIVKELYTGEADSRGENLTINLLWNNNEVNASAGRSWGTARIKLFGGLVRYQYATADFIASTLCHEIGHLYGGSPQFPGENSSAEGQSDYYIGKQCIFDVMSRYAATETPTQDPLVVERCAQIYKTVGENTSNPTQNVVLCQRALEAAKIDGIMLAEGHDQVTPNMSTPPDLTIVGKTNVDYPATAQCRFDTELAGMLGTPRPKCWYAGADTHNGAVPLISNKIIVTQDTFLKKSTNDATTLPGADKCSLALGSIINYSQRSLENGHYKINISSAPTSCPDFKNTLYILMPFSNEIYPSLN